MGEARIGLALGAGGARGGAHVAMLAALDEMDRPPGVIAGSSIGAIVGALYGAGLSGEEIRSRIETITVSEKDTWRDIFDKRRKLFRWLEALLPEMGSGGLLRSDKFVEYLFEGLKAERFEDLRVDMKIVCCDFWTAQEVVFDSGPLMAPLKATMAVPGVFAPVLYRDRVLIDGGVVNPVPFELILDECEVSVAVDIGAERVAGEEMLPGVFDAIFGSFQILQRSVMNEKLEHSRPDIYVRPEIRDVRLMQFEKMSQVYEQSRPAIERFKEQLGEHFEPKPENR